MYPESGVLFTLPTSDYLQGLTELAWSIFLSPDKCHSISSESSSLQTPNPQFVHNLKRSLSLKHDVSHIVEGKNKVVSPLGHHMSLLKDFANDLTKFQRPTWELLT